MFEEGWTDQRVQSLMKLWLDGLSASQVAKKLGGVSRSAVIGKVHRLGLSGRAAPAAPGTMANNRTKPPRQIRPVIQKAKSTSSAKPPQEQKKPADSFEVAPTATIITLSEHGCRWPIGDPGEAGFGFCGRERRRDRSPYCADHASLARATDQQSVRTRDLIRELRRYT